MAQAVVQACDCKRDRSYVQFPLQEMKYLYSLWYRGKKCGVEVPQFNTRFLQNMAANWERSVLTYILSDYPTMYGIQQETDLFLFTYAPIQIIKKT